MTDYKELKERLRAYARMDKAAGKGASVLAYEDSINAIEELEEKLQYERENVEEAKEYINFLKDKINSLTHNGYYTGVYIKSLIESEERSSDWKDEESVTFFPANKEVEE